MNPLKMVINFGLSLVLMLLLVFTQLAFVSSATLLDSSYYSNKLAAGGYYRELKKTIENGFASLGPATGLPKEVFADTIDIKWLETEGDNYLKSIINYVTGKNTSIKYELDTKPIKDKLQNNINAYAKSIGVVISKDAADSINRVIDQGANIAKNYLAVINTKETSLTQARRIGTILFNYRFPLALLSLLGLGVLFLVNYRTKRAFWQWLTYSVLAAGFFILIPSGLVLLSKVLNRLAISNAYLKDALSGILGGFFTTLAVVGAVNIGVGVLGIILAQRKSGLQK